MKMLLEVPDLPLEHQNVLIWRRTSLSGIYNTGTTYAQGPYPPPPPYCAPVIKLGIDSLSVSNSITEGLKINYGTLFKESQVIIMWAVR